jgi:hypothetical protein
LGRDDRAQLLDLLDQLVAAEAFGWVIGQFACIPLSRLPLATAQAATARRIPANDD